MCCGTKKCALAPKNVLWHQKNVLRHKNMCYDTRTFATALNNLLRQLKILPQQKIRFDM